ncbi:LysR family transcriptional regulator [Stenotrophomonas maltophilia]|uniref:Transcriptional regulator, LysR family n=1 Tax=Stenotrophomonas maltophilia (strain R551-3) TaxID=391008 RepID=B4STJ1_STRM5|nr:LysR substrate-binding domain-containing protein [Stenotrophomonas maltophilia]ACF51415.1 transcriptional regulator, LysR family [Stenotrophomonas maltophilia R551-3]MBA0396536.1 LysR family transcriptional regulator [Stenotrophomonas maltophilia]MBH1494928.1 LysR family transcriptional regulator [Stenotrophomonas maltophilia]MBN4961389.1 LysR family transcriptional regulator [Stenotrophomonas maltophilia]PJL07034.1 LysR family transcriptional regulator [Stenotrophomonas maltophilia]
MDSLAGLSLFVLVAEARSFAAAARQRGITPSAASKTIARLEERLGARLLNRNTRSVSLTAEGEQFLERCRRIMVEVAAAERELTDAHAAPSGRLKASLPLVSGLMLPLLSAFAHRFPAIELDLHFSDRLVDVIEEGFDVVVRTGSPADSRLHGRNLGSTRLLCVGAPAYFANRGTPRHPDELGGHACLLHRFPGTGLIERWPLQANAAGQDVRLMPAMTANHLETILHMAIDGHGIACLPDFATRDALGNGTLVSILDEWTTEQSTFWALWPSHRHLQPRVRVFVDFMAGHLLPEGGGHN